MNFINKKHADLFQYCQIGSVSCPTFNSKEDRAGHGGWWAALEEIGSLTNGFPASPTKSQLPIDKKFILLKREYRSSPNKLKTVNSISTPKKKKKKKSTKLIQLLYYYFILLIHLFLEHVMSVPLSPRNSIQSSLVERIKTRVMLTCH